VGDKRLAGKGPWETGGKKRSRSKREEVMNLLSTGGQEHKGEWVEGTQRGKERDTTDHEVGLGEVHDSRLGTTRKSKVSMCRRIKTKTTNCGLDTEGVHHRMNREKTMAAKKKRCGTFEGGGNVPARKKGKEEG